MQKRKFHQRKIALIAGAGDLPEQVIVALQKLNIKFSVIIFDNIASIRPKNVEIIEAKFENIAELFFTLESGEYNSVICCGYMHRPRLDLNEISEESKLILEPIMSNFKCGDEAIFRSILHLFNEKSIEPLSIKELIPESFPAKEFLTDRKPDASDHGDAKRAKEIFSVISPADLGQSVLVRDGLCIGIETSLGTDHVLSSLVGKTKQGNIGNKTGGVLYKSPKINQNPFLDLPVIGRRTILGVKEAGLNGVVIEYSQVIILKPSETIQLANKLGIFIWCRK